MTVKSKLWPRPPRWASVGAGLPGSEPPSPGHREPESPRTKGGCSELHLPRGRRRDDGSHGALHSKAFPLYTRLISNRGRYFQNNTDKLLFSPIKIVRIFFFFLTRIFSADKDTKKLSQPCTAGGGEVNGLNSPQNVIISSTKSLWMLTQFDTVIPQVKMYQKE